MKNLYGIFILVLFTLILVLPYIFNFSLTDLNSPYMFEDEICSYNGTPNKTNIINSTFIIHCECQPEFSTDLSKNRTINGVLVQCSYEKKRRFIALFLSIFLPIGVDYLYLGHYFIFVIIFLTCIVTLIGNCFRFAISPHEDYFKNRSNLIFIIMAVTMFFWWIMNVALIWTGLIKDGNGFETVDDLNFLININN